MAVKRTVLWTAACPAAIYPLRVTLDSAGWAHATDAEGGHPEVLPHLEAARDAIEKPTSVFQSRTRPESIVFFNENVTNVEGDALAVPVLVRGFEGIVTSVHFRPSTYPGKLIWKA